MLVKTKMRVVACKHGKTKQDGKDVTYATVLWETLVRETGEVIPEKGSLAVPGIIQTGDYEVTVDVSLSTFNGKSEIRLNVQNIKPLQVGKAGAQ